MKDLKTFLSLHIRDSPKFLYTTQGQIEQLENPEKSRESKNKNGPSMDFPLDQPMHYHTYKFCLIIIYRKSL